MSDDTSSDWQPNFGGVSQNPPAWAAKRPVRIALLGDFSAGALSGRLETGADLGKRKPLKVEFDTLDDALGRLDLKLNLPLGADGAPVEIEISELESFHPDELYRNVEVFSALAGLRKQLNNTATFAKAAAQVAKFSGSTVRASSLARRSKARGSAPAKGAKLDDFARLTGRPSAAAQAETSVDALLKNILGPFVKPAANPQKDALVATVDAGLTDAMRAVLHHGDFQTTESLWRGVDFLLRRLETSHQLQVHLFDISAEELAADLSSVEDLSDSGLYKLLVETPSQDADGGYTYLAGLYQFDATPPHAELLGRAARVCAHAGAPFITAMTTDPFANRREPPHKLVQQAFTALREMSDASWLGLLGPRFLLRHPYGKKSDPISSFNFEEFSREAGLRGMLWGHPALLALCVLGVRGGQLAINDLPFHHVVDSDGDSVALPCTDRLINTNIATLLRDYGINALMAHKGEALVKLSGLEAINGDGLAAAGGSAPKKASDSRFALQGNINKEEKEGAEGWSAPVRKAGAAGASAVAVAASADEEASSDAQASADEEVETASSDGDSSSESSDSSGGDSELDALLASLDSGSGDSSSEAAADAPAEGAAEAEDPELAALLASLG